MSTAPDDESSPVKPELSGNSDGSSPPPESAAPADTATTATATPDDLPEWEPLTPELVEDEAIRGDFVMRWAVVGLAILLGCSQIAETKTLIHIRSGEYLASHGVLPPANDYLAYTRAELPWVNLSWLFDLVAAGVHALGGGISLSIFQALVAAAIFALLVHTTRPGVRTWWGSICAALALVACFRQFTIQPELITLLGVATTMWLLVRTQEGSSSKAAWALVPLIWAWSQLDSRAFLGWGLLLLYGLGELVGSVLGRPGFTDAGRRRQFWLIAGISVLAAGFHPFTWQVWTAPGTLYGVEYPAWRAAYPIPSRSELGAYSLFDQRYRIMFNHEGVAGLYLAAAALVTMLLNQRRVPMAHVFVFAGINAAACVASHELAAASLVNCVLATLNAQEWYLGKYGQTYSIQWSFLLFSRGGRAVTVLSLFAVAYLIISGRIDGPNGKRTGLGFEEPLQTLMTGYEQALADSYDDRPFSFVVRQGDLVIWAGQKSFVDSRLELFFTGEETLLALHSKTRAALRFRKADLAGSGDKQHWRKVFDQYKVTHVAVRMTGLAIQPNYNTFDDLAKSFDWKLTDLTSAVAVFYRTDLVRDKPLKTYVDDHKLNVVDVAFKAETTPVADPQVWPAATTAYQQALSLPKSTTPGDVALAGHYFHYATQNNLKPQQQVAALYMAIRAARAGLRADPNSADGYRTLGAAYSVLDQFEGAELRRYGVAVPHLLRYYQIAAAYQSALMLEPNDPFLNQELAGFYLRLQRIDLALKHVKEVMRLRPPAAPGSESEAEQQLAQVTKLSEQLEGRLEALEGEIDKQLERETDRLTVAMWAYQNGAVLAAIKTLEDDKVSLVQSPPAQVMLSGWLIEAGRVEEAEQMARGLESSQPGIESLAGWRDNAGYAAWAQGNYPRVAKLLQDAISTGEQRRLTSSLMSSPLTSSSGSVYPWMHLLAMEDIQGRRPDELGSLLTNLALCRLEQGDLPAAKASVEQALASAPDSFYRPLLLMYWYCLTDEMLEIEPPSEWIPISGDMFAADAPE